MKYKIKEISEQLFCWLAGIVQGNEISEPQQVADWDSEDWQTAKIIIFIHGMGPLWGYLIENGRVSNNMPDGIKSYLADQYQENKRRVEKIYAASTEILKALESEKVNYIVFKGIELANTRHVDPGIRPMADIDVYVGSKNIPGVMSCLDRLNYTVHTADNNGATLFSKGYIDQMKSGDQAAQWHSHVIISKNKKWYEGERADFPFSVDVHYKISKISYLIRYDLTSEFEKNLVPGQKVLSDEINFIHLAVHCAKHLLTYTGRWIQLYDIVVFLECSKTKSSKAENSRMNIHEVVELAKQHKVSHLVLLPLVLIGKIFGVKYDELEEKLRRNVSLRHRWLISRIELSEMSCCNPWGANLFTSFVWVRTVSDLFMGFSGDVKKHDAVVTQNANKLISSGSLMSRIKRIVRNNLKLSPRPLWYSLEIQGHDPKNDWK